MGKESSIHRAPAHTAAAGIRIKLCGLRRAEDILLANELQPDYIGFIFAPKSFRYVTAARAKELRRDLNRKIRAVGVFVNESPGRIAALLEDGVIDAAQLHGQETDGDIRRLQDLTDRPIWKAFRVADAGDIALANESLADLVLLDHGAGGTGAAFDWRLLAGMRRPYMLAGGLTGDNITQALATATGGDENHLYGVDVSSGVEIDGWKDAGKAAHFVSAVRSFMPQDQDLHTK